MAHYSEQDWVSRSEKEFFKKLVRARSPYALPRLINLSLPLSIVEKFLPAAHLETWPLNRLQGVYRIDYGGSLNPYFQNTIVGAAFSMPTDEDVEWIERMKSATKSYYSDPRNSTVGHPSHPLRKPCQELEKKQYRN